MFNTYINSFQKPDKGIIKLLCKSDMILSVMCSGGIYEEDGGMYVAWGRGGRGKTGNNRKW